jgi:hypothetical protein
LGVKRHGQTIRGICAGIMEKHIVHAKNATFLIESCFRIMDLSALVSSGLRSI